MKSFYKLSLLSIAIIMSQTYINADTAPSYFTEQIHQSSIEEKIYNIILQHVTKLQTISFTNQTIAIKTLEDLKHDILIILEKDSNTTQYNDLKISLTQFNPKNFITLLTNTKKVLSHLPTTSRQLIAEHLPQSLKFIA